MDQLADVARAGPIQRPDRGRGRPFRTFPGRASENGAPGADLVGRDGHCSGRRRHLGAASDIRQIRAFWKWQIVTVRGVASAEAPWLRDVAAAEHDGVKAAFDQISVAAQNFHAAGGSAGDQAGASADQAAQIDGMEAVHVFGGIDGFKIRLVSTCAGSGSLNQDAVDVVVAIEVFDDGEKFERADCGWWRKQRTGEAELFAGGDFAFHVKLGRGIFADQDGGEARANACGGEQADFVAQLSENLIADFGAVEDSRGHFWLAFFAEGEAAKLMIAHARETGLSSHRLPFVRRRLD